MISHQSSLTIGDTTYDRVVYDPDADVLYLHVGDPSSAVDFDESPEGHHLRFDSSGRLVGITMVGVRQDLETGQPLVITLPALVKVDSGVLRGVLSAA